MPTEHIDLKTVPSPQDDMAKSQNTNSPPWREFELLISRIQKQLSPEAQVKHDHWIKGKSGRKRKCDVTISQKIGTASVLVVIDCKHHNKPVKMKYVESFAGQCIDVGANLGIVVSDSGFDAGALAVAPNLGLALQHYREASELDWKRMVGSGGWIVYPKVSVEFLSVHAKLEGRHRLEELPLCTALHLPDSEESSTIFEHFKDMPKQTGAMERLGNAAHGITLEFPAFVEGVVESESAVKGASIGDIVRFRVEHLIFRILVKAEKYIFNISIKNGKLIEDALNKDIKHWELKTETYTWSQIEAGSAVTPLNQDEFDKLIAASEGIMPDADKNEPFSWSVTGQD